MREGLEMKTVPLDLDNLNELFPDDFTPDQAAAAQTAFLKRVSLAAAESIQPDTQPQVERSP